jgi:hypothetical protein
MGVLPVEPRQVVNSNITLVELEFIEPVVMPSTLLDRLNLAGVKFPTLYDFDMTVVAQQDRQPGARENQQKAHMKDQQPRLSAETPVRKQRRQQIHDEHRHGNRGDVTANRSAAAARDGKHHQHGHPDERQPQRGEYSEKFDHGGGSQTSFIHSSPTPGDPLAEPQSCTRQVPLCRQLMTFNLAFI